MIKGDQQLPYVKKQHKTSKGIGEGIEHGAPTETGDLEGSCPLVELGISHITTRNSKSSLCMTQRGTRVARTRWVVRLRHRKWVQPGGLDWSVNMADINHCNPELMPNTVSKNNDLCNSRNPVVKMTSRVINRCIL